MITALHGFLGQPSDFKCFTDLELSAPNLFIKDNINFHRFAKEFNNQVIHPQILLGYSMGGRLALHLLLDRPKNWKAAIIISTHPGLKTYEERCLRKEHDRCWLKRFENGVFSEVMNDWNAQAIFNNEKKIVSEIIPTKQIAQCLDLWSLAHQENLREPISKLTIPIFWIVGEMDLKFRLLSEELEFLHPKSRVWIAEKAAHRVPWQVKDEFQTQVNLFLGEL